MPQTPTCTNTRIRSTSDAEKIFFAAKQRLVPMVTRRLDAEERAFLKSGCCYAWEERGGQVTEIGIERFTEGRRWSPSRVRDSFLFYYEKWTPDTDTGASGSKQPPSDWDQLVKQTYSVWVDTPQGRRKWHLTAYFTQKTVDELGTIDEIPGVSELEVPEGLFQSTRSSKRRRTDDILADDRSVAEPSIRGDSTRNRPRAVSRTYAAFQGSPTASSSRLPEVPSQSTVHLTPLSYTPPIASNSSSNASSGPSYYPHYQQLPQYVPAHQSQPPSQQQVQQQPYDGYPRPNTSSVPYVNIAVDPRYPLQSYPPPHPQPPPTEGHGYVYNYAQNYNAPGAYYPISQQHPPVQPSYPQTSYGLVQVQPTSYGPSQPQSQAFSQPAYYPPQSQTAYPTNPPQSQPVYPNNAQSSQSSQYPSNSPTQTGPSHTVIPHSQLQPNYSNIRSQPPAPPQHPTPSQAPLQSQTSHTSNCSDTPSHPQSQSQPFQAPPLAQLFYETPQTPNDSSDGVSSYTLRPVYTTTQQSSQTQAHRSHTQYSSPEYTSGTNNNTQATSNPSRQRGESFASYPSRSSQSPPNIRLRSSSSSAAMAMRPSNSRTDSAHAATTSTPTSPYSSTSGSASTSRSTHYASSSASTSPIVGASDVHRESYERRTSLSSVSAHTPDTSLEPELDYHHQPLQQQHFHPPQRREQPRSGISSERDDEGHPVGDSDGNGSDGEFPHSRKPIITNAKFVGGLASLHELRRKFHPYKRDLRDEEQLRALASQRRG